MKNLCRILLSAMLLMMSFCGCGEQPTSVLSPNENTTTGMTEEPAINTALFGEIGKTYSQLVEAYGEVTHVFYDEGAPIYRFEQTDWFYSFEGFCEVEGGYESIPLTEDGYWELSDAPFPADYERCTGIYYAAASDLFVGLSEATESGALAEKYRLDPPRTNVSFMTSQCFATFVVDSYYVSVECKDETYIVEPDAFVRIQTTA